MNLHVFPKGFSSEYGAVSKENLALMDEWQKYLTVLAGIL
jgi:hypothetical protein